MATKCVGVVAGIAKSVHICVELILLQVGIDEKTAMSTSVSSSKHAPTRE